MKLDPPIQITALFGRLLVLFCVYTWLVQLPLYYRIICIVNSFVSADRRATARTTTSLSHAAIRQKKNVFVCIPFSSISQEVGCGTSLWHIVRLVLLRSSILSPLICFNTPPQRPLSSTFFQTSPLGDLSYFKRYLVQWHSPHFDLYFYRFLL